MLTEKNKIKTTICYIFIVIITMTTIVQAGETLVTKKTEINSSKTDLGTGFSSGGVKDVFSLINPERFSMSHSYAINYSTGNQGEQMIAMYLNKIDYQIAKQLKLSVAIAWMHSPQTALGISSNTIGSEILPSFRLDWKPSKNFH